MACPISRIHFQQLGLFVLREGKKLRFLGLKGARTTRGWPTTHEHGWIVIMAQANGMPELVRNQITRDIGQRERSKAVAPDAHQDFAASR